MGGGRPGIVKVLAQHVPVTRHALRRLHPPARVRHAVRRRHKALLLLLLLRRPLLQLRRIRLQSTAPLSCVACDGMQAAACRTSEAGNSRTLQENITVPAKGSLYGWDCVVVSCKASQSPANLRGRTHRPLT